MDINKVKAWFQGSYMYEEGDRQLELSRVAGGLVLPLGTKPGFAVLVATERFLEIGFSCRRMHALTEIEEYDLDGLIRQCIGLSHKLQIRDWWGHTSEANMVTLHTFNRQQQTTNRPQFNLMAAPMVKKDSAADCFRYGLARIQERTLPGRKSLELSATPKIQAALTMIPPESATGQEIENYPPVAALSFCVAALDIYDTPEAGQIQTHTDNSSPGYSRLGRGVQEQRTEGRKNRWR
jgi:hypothetical protein